MKKYLAIIGSALLLAFGGAWGVTQVSAMASQFIASTYGVGLSTQTSATTTQSFLTPGAGTTTVLMTVPSSVATKYDNAFIGIDVSATGTAQNSLLKARIEYSWDNIDWYGDVVASSSQAQLGNGILTSELSFNVATSTTYNNVGAGVQRVNFGFFVQTPTPYTRVVFYSPIGGANFALHVRAQPIKQVQIINQ